MKADIYEMFPFFMFQPTASSCKPRYFPIICFYTEAIQYLCVDIPLKKCQTGVVVSSQFVTSL